MVLLRVGVRIPPSIGSRIPGRLRSRFPEGQFLFPRAMRIELHRRVRSRFPDRS
jgi:hypothetical protein